MVFKRRAKRSYARILAEAFYPRGGWTRAFHYVRHRLHRLPDKPYRIARGVAAGVFVSFTPFFGLHFIFAALVAKLIRGNILASLLATFFGNPLTFPIIGFVSLKLGHLILGTRFDVAAHASLLSSFTSAGGELKDNFFAIFTDETAHWESLIGFFDSVFLPYLVGGIVPGIMTGVAFYYLSEPVIAAYQKRRRKKLKERFEKLKAKLHARAGKGSEGG
ncbi:DUF2062 domain-containing protein [Ostreiculturibacter nitratireducens]|uniref:DUF2062 domain-containing protein n=1 Tax=Ostreiculturibacter nitratireducens TaxID=3075226 RepID=UPI0031B61968